MALVLLGCASPDGRRHWDHDTRAAASTDDSSVSGALVHLLGARGDVGPRGDHSLGGSCQGWDSGNAQAHPSSIRGFRRQSNSQRVMHTLGNLLRRWLAPIVDPRALLSLAVLPR